ncbi:MAG TPA: SRPBCC domain-containing protein [Pseudolabrys sp.]
MSGASAKSAEIQFGEGTVEIVRVFDAPRALVWQAWTDPKMMAQWFGPRGFSSRVPELDVRVGGNLRIVMHGPDGNDYPMKGTFREIVAPERLVFSNIAIDNDGNHLLEGVTTVTFAEQGAKTTMTLHTHAVGRVPIAKQMLTGMEAGWTQSIDKLEELLEKAS